MQGLESHLLAPVNTVKKMFFRYNTIHIFIWEKKICKLNVFAPWPSVKQWQHLFGSRNYKLYARVKSFKIHKLKYTETILPRINILNTLSACFPCASVARMVKVNRSSVLGARPLRIPLTGSSLIPGGSSPPIRL